jgi:hypothetical protein
MVHLLASLCHRYLARLTTYHTMTHKCWTEVCVSKVLPFNSSMIYDIIWYDIYYYSAYVSGAKYLTCTWSIPFDSNHACSELLQANLKKTERKWKVRRLNETYYHVFITQNYYSVNQEIKPRGYTIFHLFTFGATCVGLNSHHQGSLSTVRSFQDHYKLNLSSS